MFFVYAMHDAERRGDQAEADGIRRRLMAWPMENERGDRAPYRPEYIAAVVNLIRYGTDGTDGTYGLYSAKGGG